MNSQKVSVKENITIYQIYWQKRNIFHEKLYEVVTSNEWFK
jgi:hypothetical protein